MKRLLKQILISSVYLGIFILAAWGIFNAVYTPTCADKLKNQGEEKTDCGGPCLPCDLRKLSGLIIAKKVYFLDLAGNTIDAGFQVKNPNPDWGVNNLEYQIDFIGPDAKVIPGSVYGSTFLLPSESKWVMAIKKHLASPISELQVKIATSSAVWKQLRSYVSETNFVVKDLLYQRLTPPRVGYAEITGVVMNKSGFQVDNLEIQGLAYDGSGAVIGITQTTIFDLRVAESREFTLFWPRPFSKDMKDYQVFVNVNLMNNENFLQKYAQ